VWIALLTPPLAIVLALIMERLEAQVTPTLSTGEANDPPHLRRMPKVVKPRMIEVQRWPARVSRPDRGRQPYRDKAPVRPSR
jgi:hypothetical protein